MKKICRGKIRFRFYIKIRLLANCCDMDLFRWVSINFIEIVDFLIIFIEIIYYKSIEFILRGI